MFRGSYFRVYGFCEGSWFGYLNAGSGQKKRLLDVPCVKGKLYRFARQRVLIGRRRMPSLMPTQGEGVYGFFEHERADRLFRLSGGAFRAKRFSRTRLREAI